MLKIDPETFCNEIKLWGDANPVLSSYVLVHYHNAQTIRLSDDPDTEKR